MIRTVKAVYENGVLRPLEPLELAEHQPVTVTVDESSAKTHGEALRALQEVLSQRTPEEMDELRAIVLDRSRFFTPRA